MSPETDPNKDLIERRPFLELEDKEFANSIVVELVPNGQFTDEQIERIINFSAKGWNGDIDEERFVECRRAQHITFSPYDDTSRLFLCLANGKQWSHKHMWGLMNVKFEESLTLRDGGYFEITLEDSKQYFSKYISKGLSEETGEITPAECFQCRAQISEMDIGIEILE